MMEQNMFCPQKTSTVFFPALILLLLTLLLLCLMPFQVNAAPTPRAVLIIDGSGSMWGRVDGREKIVIVRSQLAAKLKLLQGKVDLGVMSYGHRRRRDCRDIEMLRAIGPIELKSHGDKIKRLLPRGKTPTSSALQMAAKALAADPLAKTTPLHIILVADGIENCRLDPCETASKLASKYPRLTIDVIGFAVKNKELPQLQCIARNTKGRFLKAASASELQVAISKIFTRLGKKGIAPSARSAKTQKKTPAGLYLTAGLGQQGKALDEGMGWRIYKAGESSKNGATPLQRDQRAAPLLSLPQGKYHIEARYKSLLTQGDVTLGADRAVKKRLSFNVGIVTASARLGEKGAPSNDIIFSLYDIAKGPAGPGNNIAHKQGENAVFYLPPGKYNLTARNSEAQASSDFTLQAGSRTRQDLLLNAGRVALRTTLVRGAPPLDDVQYAIFRQGDKTGQGEKNRDVEFVRTLDPTPQLVLPIGNYFVLARRGAATNYTAFAIRPGDSKKLSLTLDAGVLTLSSSGHDPSSQKHPQIAYTITPIAPTRPQTIKLSTKGKLAEIDQTLPIRSFRNRFTLPKGDYLIHAHYGNSNAGASRRVHIGAGAKQQVKIEMNAGRVRLSLALMAGDPPLPNVFWSIFNKSGKQVASASSSVPRLTLAKGAYQAVAQYLGQNFRRDFVVQNGDDKTLKLSVQ